MPVRGWQKRLEEASEPEDVVLVVNDFLAQWTPVEIAALPENCSPGRMENAQHVNAYALKLAHFHCSSDPRVASNLHRMTTFFTKAALRVYQILERTEDVPPEIMQAQRAAGRTTS